MMDEAQKQEMEAIMRPMMEKMMQEMMGGEAEEGMEGGEGIGPKKKLADMVMKNKGGWCLK